MWDLLPLSGEAGKLVTDHHKLPNWDIHSSTVQRLLSVHSFLSAQSDVSLHALNHSISESPRPYSPQQTKITQSTHLNNHWHGNLTRYETASSFPRTQGEIPKLRHTQSQDFSDHVIVRWPLEQTRELDSMRSFSLLRNVLLIVGPSVCLCCGTRSSRISICVSKR